MKYLLSTNSHSFVLKDIDSMLNKPDTLVVGHSIICFDNLFLNNWLQQFEYATITKDQCFDTSGELKAALIGFKKEAGISWGQYHASAIGKRVKGVKHKLEDACSYYGVPVEDAFHGAVADVEYTYQVFLKQVERIRAEDDEIEKAKVFLGKMKKELRKQGFTKDEADAMTGL